MTTAVEQGRYALTEIAKDVPFRVQSITDDGFVDLESIRDTGLMTGIQWEKSFGPLPKKGEVLLVVTKGFGHMNEGFKRSDGTWIKTKEDIDREHQEWLDEIRRQAEQEYQEKKASYAELLELLTEPYKQRMLRFIEKYGEHDFYVKEGGDYELFIVTQSDGLYKTWQATGASPDWFDWFYDSTSKKQHEMFPELEDGHSGNTFGSMVYLAKAVAQGKEI